MTRVLAVFVALAAAAAAPSLAHAAGVAHPNPAFVSPQVDYVGPLQAPDGTVASLTPLDPSVTEQAVHDQAWLAYRHRDDLGGFLPAPLGKLALSSGGHVIVGVQGRASELPQFAQAASGDVRSFAFAAGGAAPAPDNGRSPLPGLGVPPLPPPPTNQNATPPANQGFGGRPVPTPAPATTTTTPGKSRPGTTTPTTTTLPGTTPTTTTTPPPPPPPPPPTTTTPAPTAPTTTAPGTTTRTTTNPPPPPPPLASCGTIGLSLTSDVASCRIAAVNQAPGDAAVEHVTIRNDSTEPFTLSLKASGTPNQLWNDLQLGVWEQGAPAPSPLPALLWWTLGENPLATLAPGQQIKLVIELALPASAGNADQGLAAVIDFHWHAEA